jgi:hypothetical protein
MNWLTGYSVSAVSRELLALCFLASLFLAVWRVTKALRVNSKSRGIASVITARKSDTYSSNAHQGNLTNPQSSPSIPTGIDRRKRLGAAKVAGLAVAMSLLVIGAVGGGVGFVVQSATAKQYPYVTIGCTESDTTRCKSGDMVDVVKVAGRRVLFHHANASELANYFWLKICPGPKLPFDPGDVLIFFKYEERYDCEALGQHWGIQFKRDNLGRTTSEAANGESE